MTRRRNKNEIVEEEQQPIYMQEELPTERMKRLKNQVNYLIWGR